MMVRLDGKGNFVPDVRHHCEDVLLESYSANPKFELRKAKVMSGGEIKRRRLAKEALAEGHVSKKQKQLAKKKVRTRQLCVSSNV